MSEAPSTTERTIADVQKEYFQLAAQFGDIAFRVKLMTADLEAIAVAMKARNEEANEFQKRAAEAKQASDASPASSQ